MGRRVFLFSLLTLALIFLLPLEFILLSQLFDSYLLLKNQTVSSWQVLFAYPGKLLRLFVLFAVVFLFLGKKRLQQDWSALIERFTVPRYLSACVAHVLFFAAFFFFTQRLFGVPESNSSIPTGIFLGWLATGLGCVAAIIVGTVGFGAFFSILKRERGTLLIALLVSIFTWLFAMAGQDGWQLLVDQTFAVVVFLLGFFYDPSLLTVQVDEKVIGLGQFLIYVAPACSGYEGIGLILTFTAIYIFIHRSELIFPRVFLLFPFGALVIWLFNSVRIALLIMIGHHWSPKVAVDGFHSQAGWITFILTSLILLWVTGRVNWLRKPDAVGVKDEPFTVSTPIAMLLPIITLLAITLLTAAFTASFDYWYPLRVIVVAIVVLQVWRYLDLSLYKLHPLTLPCGLLVAIIWGLMLGSNADANQQFETGLESMSQPLAIGWLIFRLVGTAITVPIAEELAFRGYLLCRVAGVDVAARGFLPFHIIAFVGSSLAFGFLHGQWLAGTVAGLLYALLRWRTQHLGDAIVAHGVTNGALFAYAAASGEWWLL